MPWATPRVRALSVALATLVFLTANGVAHGQVSVSENSIEEHGAGFDMRFVYPQIGILSDDAEISAWVQSLVDGFKNDLAERPAQAQMYGAQLSYEVARNDDAVVSIGFVYSVYLGGAHPSSERHTFNFLMPDGARVFLPELIGDDGIKRVSDLAIADLSRKLDRPTSAFESEWIRQGAGPYADNFDTFELLPDQIVLEFDPYVVASYAEGPQEVRIPLARLQDVLRPDPRAPLPSFDCLEARTPIELAICSDAPLAQLDRRVAEAYARRLRLGSLYPDTAKVRADQVDWLSKRDATCAGNTAGALVACLKDEYAPRLEALRRYP